MMNSKRALNAEKWSSIVKRYKQSGLTLTGYSKKIGVNKYTLSYWVKKFSENQVVDPAPRFVKLERTNRHSTSRLYIRYKTGTELDLPVDYDLGRLIELISH